MNRSVCLRALLLAPFTLIELHLAVLPGATQTPPQTDPSKLQPVRDAPKDGPRQTPAQEKYGVPKNPIVGDAVDVDLSKPLSLDRAVRIGLQRQNSIAISRTQTEAANQRLIQSRSAYFPQITPTYQFNFNRTPGLFIQGQQIGGGRDSRTDQTNLVASLQIFDTGQREARIGQSRRSLYATEYGLGNERQNVVLDVTEGYYNLLRTKELLRVQEQTVARAKTNLESIQAQVSVGNAAKSDTLQAEADLANAEVNLLAAQVDYEVAQAQLKNSMGIVSYEPVKLTEETVPPPPTQLDNNSLEEYVGLAFGNRLDVKQQQEQVNAQGYNVRLAQINAGITTSADIRQGFQFSPGEGETRFLTFSLSYPLFDGGNTRAAVRESKSNLDQTKRSLDQLEQSIRFAVEQAFRTREQSRRRYAASQTAVRAAQLNYDASLERQRQGIVNILEVINAQLQLVNAQVSNVQATYDYYVADARLRRAVGMNDPDYQPRVPGVTQRRVTLKSGKPVSFFSSLAQNAPNPSVLTPPDLSLYSNRGGKSGSLTATDNPVAERKP